MEYSFTFDDILLVPNYNHYESRRMVSLESQDRTEKLKLSVPLISSNMDTITGSAMANFMGDHGGMGILHRFMDIAENVQEFKKSKHPTKTGVSVGCSEQELERAEALRDAGAEIFCLDVAHAHSKYAAKTIKRLREMLPNQCIIGGNVASYAGADYLASVGADIIKVGIGPGSVCTTRIKTGFGVPALSAIKDCSRIDRSIIADGGIRTPGDIVKALAFGADFVMIGGMLAGTAFTPGEVMEKDGKKFKKYRGMASREAQEDFMGQMGSWKTDEGVQVLVPYRDDVNEIMADLIGGIRSGLTYGGSATIKELQRKCVYVMVTAAGRAESLPHKQYQTGVAQS